MNIISFKNVHFTYPGDDQESLCGIDLDIAAGSFVAVLGHNGSGKSTLAKHMNAILVPSTASTPPTRIALSTCAAPWAWCSRTPTTR